MASLRAWLIFSNVNNHRADDEISWFAAVHRWSLSQMATASTWTSTTSSPSSQISEYTRGNLKRKAWSKHLNQRSFQKNTSLPPLCLVSPLPLLLGKVPPPGADSGQPAASSRDTTSCQLKSQNRGNWAFTKWKNVWGLTIAPLLLAWETQVLPSWSVAPRLAFAWTQER